MAKSIDITGAGESNQVPTYVARISGTKLDPEDVVMAAAIMLSEPGQGCDIQSGWGLWEGSVERSVTITMQTSSPYRLEKLLLGILNRIPEVRWIHVERHTPDVAYVDGDEIRDYYRSRI